MSRAPQPSFVTLPGHSPESPATLFDYLLRRFPKVEPSVWRGRIERGLVRLEEVPITLDTPFIPRARISYYREVESEPELPSEEAILFEDDHVVVADKPPFQPVTPSGPWVNSCLLYRLRQRTRRKNLAPAHRLDLETAGLVLFSRRPEHRAAYTGLFAKGEVRKVYKSLAHVDEPPGRRRWQVESRIEQGEPWFRMREVPGLLNARSVIELLDWKDGVGLFELKPETGKTHQLRLHLASLGFPIVNDRLYPELQPKSARDLEEPLRLLASELHFRDPVTGEERSFESRQRLDLRSAPTATDQPEVSPLSKPL